MKHIFIVSGYGDANQNCHAVFEDVRRVNLPFLPCSFPERWMMKAETLGTSDSAPAPLERTDTLIAGYFFVLRTGSCNRMF